MKNIIPAKDFDVRFCKRLLARVSFFKFLFAPKACEGIAAMALQVRSSSATSWKRFNRSAQKVLHRNTWENLFLSRLLLTTDLIFLDQR